MYIHMQCVSLNLHICTCNVLGNFCDYFVFCAGLISYRLFVACMYTSMYMYVHIPVHAYICMILNFMYNQSMVNAVRATYIDRASNGCRDL